MDSPTDAEERYLQAALEAARLASGFLRHMEDVAERLDPERLPGLSEEIRRGHEERLQRTSTALGAAPAPAPLHAFSDRLAAALAHVRAAFELFARLDTAPAAARIGCILQALHHCARAQEGFYTLRRVLPPFADFWSMPGTGPADPGHDATPSRTGVVHVSPGGSHGGFSLYVPEGYRDDRPWPLIIALHGGSGNGADFLWTWLREARSLGYLLVAPTAVAGTWTETDDRGLLQILGWLKANYRIDEDRVLLTGLSDGATFTLLFGLAHPTVYRALAPLCGVLHPANEAIGNLGRARGVPIYLVHGARDFLFPVAIARLARDTLRAAGAELTYRELGELSHTYPRSENARILRWFAALPPRAD